MPFNLNDSIDPNTAPSNIIGQLNGLASQVKNLTGESSWKTPPSRSVKIIFNPQAVDIPQAPTLGQLEQCGIRIKLFRFSKNMKFDLPSVSVFITLCLLIGSNIIWFLDKYGSNTKKKYAAEREFGHLKRNQEQLLFNLDTLFQNLENHIELMDRDIQAIKYSVGGMNSREERK